MFEFSSGDGCLVLQLMWWWNGWNLSQPAIKTLSFHFLLCLWSKLLCVESPSSYLWAFCLHNVSFSPAPRLCKCHSLVVFACKIFSFFLMILCYFLFCYVLQLCPIFLLLSPSCINCTDFWKAQYWLVLATMISLMLPTKKVPGCFYLVLWISDLDWSSMIPS